MKFTNLILTAAVTGIASVSGQRGLQVRTTLDRKFIVHVRIQGIPEDIPAANNSLNLTYERCKKTLLSEKNQDTCAFLADVFKLKMADFEKKNGNKLKCATGSTKIPVGQEVCIQ